MNVLNLKKLTVVDGTVRMQSKIRFIADYPAEHGADDPLCMSVGDLTEPSAALTRWELRASPSARCPPVRVAVKTLLLDSRAPSPLEPCVLGEPVQQ